LQRLASAAGRPLERFLQIEAASGILLLLVAALAMAWANSPWAASYAALWHTELGISIGEFSFVRSLEWVVNDVLMVIFFFVVGMEIRRETDRGELSELRRAALPAFAALGGMVAPALLYLAIAGQPSTHSGWGVPMATDIAFAVGVLTLLGKRVPAALRVLLLALAVIDDLGAIIVIALFYSAGISAFGLLVALAGMIGIYAMQAIGVRQKLLYVLPAFVVWAGVYAAGVHPTIAGVLVGLATPVRAWLGSRGFKESLQGELAFLEKEGTPSADSHELVESLKQVDQARREAVSPADALIHSLHPWVAFVIMPVFALANAGVPLEGMSLEGDAAWAALGVGVGLLVGKPLGVLLACYIAVRSNVASLPLGLTFRHLAVLGIVAGIGFTMALFVAQLAFADAALLGAAKIGVLSASALAGVVGLLLGKLALSPVERPGIALTADEAERSTEA
jgi:NhaA family Na+:H+ antiporter